MGDRSGSTDTRFRALFEPALQAYEEKTGVTLAEHPLAVQLHSCHSIESVTTVLLGEAQAFRELTHEIDQRYCIKFIQTFFPPHLSTMPLTWYVRRR